MRALLLISAPLLLSAITFAEQSPKQVPLDRLCGKLAYVERKPVKDVPNSFTSNEKPLKSQTLRLFERKDGTPCCQDMPTVAETMTHRGGFFKFKNTKPGSYWLTTKVQEHEYKMPVHFEPTKEKDAACEIYLFELDSAGGFNVLVVVTVD